MILIFGGTTEGRTAAETCDKAGSTFYYSTRGSLQEVQLRHGERLCGTMSADDIVTFCRAHHVRCIVDAAHPFALNLHQAIARARLPVIRLQRHFGKRIPNVAYCKDYDEAMRQMQELAPAKLLALSGANTIAKLKPYWTSHPTIFRILHRPESNAIAEEQGLPQSGIIFYNDSLALPSADDEKEMMRQLGCDAIITKESGESGGYEAKVQAALSLGLKVFVVEHPKLPAHWHYVTGPHSLRRAIEQLAPGFFPLRTGLTTGACATAATKAALLSLLHDECPEEVSFALPDGETMSIAVDIEGRGRASVVKDSSDDPDVTKGCRITSAVTPNSDGRIHFLQGEGVGTVTLPGLGIPVGGPAINATPRKMITDEIRSISSAGFDVTISVENGEALAQKTFNSKVGVLGGISIIGTSGIVSPLSNEAFVQSIGRELEVARAIGCDEIGIVAGKKSEDRLRQMRPGLRMVHYGNFVGQTLEKASQLGFRKVIVGIMIGKAVKLAEGNLDTHSHKVAMNKDFLKSVAADLPDSASLISIIDNVTMARQLAPLMPPAFFSKIASLCHQHCQAAFPHGEIEILLICDSPS